MLFFLRLSPLCGSGDILCKHPESISGDTHGGFPPFVHPRILAFVNSSTWLWITSFLSGARLLFFCFIGSAWLNTFIQCSVLKVSPMIINILGTPVMWAEVHAKTSTYFFKRSRSLIFILVGNCLPIVIICLGYLLFITTLSSVSVQLGMISSLPGIYWLKPPLSFGFCELYSEKMVPIPLGVWNFMAPWTVDTTIPICCIAVLPSSKLCGESDFMITNLMRGVFGPSEDLIDSIDISRKKNVRIFVHTNFPSRTESLSSLAFCFFCLSYEASYPWLFLFSNPGSQSSWKWQYLVLDQLAPGNRGGCSKVLATFSVVRISSSDSSTG
ncbi:hypothetical protein Tco_1003955 [Tanacetum coccineum]|uniref:Uncharacterized protein n=1 Tax=Tanacetum coccineum TaxID=301880 RepID=A0ABQ5FB11_9ASTR